MTNETLLLGIDIGTTKTAAAIVREDGTHVASASQPHLADLPTPAPLAEQDPRILLESVRQVIGELPEESRSRVRAVGLTGQMHGVVVLDAGGEPLTSLVTWQDRRGLEDGFVGRLASQTDFRLRVGFGCATLAWFVAHDRLPEGAASSCTIMDLMVMKLCENARPVIDPTDAASWGLFDLQSLSWNQLWGRAAKIPEPLLPEVVPCGALAGHVTEKSAGELGIPAGIPVAAALGDNQASLMATVKEPDTEVALTLGTAGQLSALLPPGRKPARLSASSRYGYRPYPGGRLAMVAAALCGGSAFEWLVTSVERWIEELGLPALSRDQVLDRINELGLKAEGSLGVRPTFLGERSDPTLRGQVGRIDMTNFTLGNVARGLAFGIVENLKGMLPPEAFLGRTQVVGSGNALRRSPLLQFAATEVLGLPLRMSEGQEEAARGAGVNAAGLLR